MTWDLVPRSHFRTVFLEIGKRRLTAAYVIDVHLTRPCATREVRRSCGFQGTGAGTRFTRLFRRNHPPRQSYSNVWHRH
jgi:hypothetical protein